MARAQSEPTQEELSLESPAALSSLEDYIQASTPIDGLSYTTQSLKDLMEEGVGIKLPLGVFLPREKGGAVERLVDFEINEEVALGSYSKLLSSWESGIGSGNAAAAAATSIASFLAGKQKGRLKKENLDPVVKSIGGIPIADIPKLYGNSLEHFFGNMYVADISTILLAVRMEIAGEKWKDYAVSYNKCPVANCGQKNVGDILDFSAIEIASYGELVRPPLFQVQLEKGFTDGVSANKEKIKNLFFAPQKLSQFHIYDGANIDDATLLSALIVAMPESEVLRGRNKPFTEEHYCRCYNVDTRIMAKALQYVQPGPRMTLPMQCACARAEEINHSINWIADLRSLLYFSLELPADV